MKNLNSQKYCNKKIKLLDWYFVFAFTHQCGALVEVRKTLCSVSLWLCEDVIVWRLSLGDQLSRQLASSNLQLGAPPSSSGFLPKYDSLSASSSLVLMFCTKFYMLMTKCQQWQWLGLHVGCMLLPWQQTVFIPMLQLPVNKDTCNSRECGHVF